MKTRRDEDRANDITAVDCAACGDCNGYTRQSGGDVVTLNHCDLKQSVDVCETCLEDFHRYGLTLPDDNRELTAEEWAQLRGYVNTERKERDDESLVPELAAQFSRILNEWLTPEAMAECVRLNAPLVAANDNSICHSHDHCDANQAMLDAWEWMFGKDEAPACIVENSTQAAIDRDDKLWNAAWSLAKSKGFKLQ